MTQKSSSSRRGTALAMIAVLMAGSAAVAVFGGHFFFAASSPSAQDARPQVMAPDHLNGGLYAFQASVARNTLGDGTPIQQPSCQQLSIVQNDDEYGGPYTQNCASEVMGANNTQAASSGSAEVIS